MTWTDPENPDETPREPADREPADRDTAGRSGWHPVHVGHLVMGVAFLGLTVVWVLLSSDTLDLADHRWLLPAPWILAGAAGLAVSAAGNARRSGRDDVTA